MVHHADPVLLACRFMRANAHLDIHLSDVARAAHLSERGLQHAFRKTLDTTPLGFLRSVRLARAHDELEGRGPAADDSHRPTVNEIARRWHFTHPSRFAAAYRAAYGQYPAEALRRRGCAAGA